MEKSNAYSNLILNLKLKLKKSWIFELEVSHHICNKEKVLEEIWMANKMEI